MRAERLKPSPLGILMHPEYGLWHAYRGALLFDVEISIQAPAEQIHLCDLCVGKPCLKSCPVDAYSERGFAYKSCLGHVRSAAGKACRDEGCLDRNACPYGTAYRYPAEVQAFHMAAFTR
jgi:epoxyqueuosine reductase QueG